MATTTVYLLKLSYGKHAPTVLGEIYLKSLVAVTQSLNVLMIGREKGAFERMLQALSGEPDMEYAMPNPSFDATIVPVHRHIYCYGRGAKGG